jgi:uncharacterized protein
VTQTERGVNGDPPSPAPEGRVLDSWKEIAAYLKRDVATVRRWEKREALPVHRHLHQKLGSVYAYTAELDAWLQSRSRRIDSPPAGRGRKVPLLGLASIAVVVIASGALGYRFIESHRAVAKRPVIRVAVHRSGTVASLIAGGLLEVLDRSVPDVDVEGVAQTGMVATLRAIDRGEVDLGLAFNLVAFHAAKTAQLLGHRSDAIVALTVAYATPAQVVVRSDSALKTVTDLRGKRVSLGIAESGERFCSQVLLSHLGFHPDDFADHSSDFSPSLADLLAGRIDAYITWRGMPVPDFTREFASGKIRLIALDRESLHGLHVNHPFLAPWTIPARVYPHQDAAIPTLSGRILLVSSRSLPSELAERVLKALAGHLPDLIARHPAAADIEVTSKPGVDDGLSIDLHPGAERFFQSVSVQ